MIGYFAFKHDTPISLQLAPSMKTTAFRLHARTGNTGECDSYLGRERRMLILKLKFELRD